MGHVPSDSMSKLAIEVRGLRKSYGQSVAVDGIDLSVAEGEIFGLLGPNGAGKTSTIEILEGIRARSGGDARVLGLDPTSQSAALKDRIGVCLQSTNLPDRIRVGEAMRLFSRLYSKGTDPDRLLERVDLADKKHAFYRTLSGGQKQRLAIALALINAPSLVFFDEPTTGLDPQVRREIHALIGELRGENCTVLLTTHYIEEAERLCGRVAIMDRGRIVAEGSPREIQERTLGRALVEARLSAPAPADAAFPAAFSVERREGERELLLRTNEPGECVAQLVRWCDGHGMRLDDVSVRRASLEDAFIALTGHTLPDAG